MAPPPACPAHRRPLLSRPVPAALVASAFAVAVLAACGADDDGTDGSVVTTPVATVASSDAASTDDASGEVAVSGVPSSDVASTDDASGEDAAPTTPPEEPPGVQPEGFTVATVRITEPDGEVCEVCVWLADTGDERSRGLMGVTDLGGAAGMLFLFEQPVSASFYMFQTPQPLSIAWFAADGTYVGEAEMAPCLDESSGACDRYGPGGEYLTALEVWSGDLPALGVGPGSRLELVAASEATSCATL